MFGRARRTGATFQRGPPEVAAACPHLGVRPRPPPTDRAYDDLALSASACESVAPPTPPPPAHPGPVIPPRSSRPSHAGGRPASDGGWAGNTSRKKGDDLSGGRGGGGGVAPFVGKEDRKVREGGGATTSVSLLQKIAPAVCWVFVGRRGFVKKIHSCAF